MPKDTRDKVTLSPEAYKALEIEAMLHGTNLKDTASKLILKAACPKCIEILEIMDRPAKEANDIAPPIEPKVPKSKATVVDVPARPSKDTKEEEPEGTITQGPKGPMAQVPNVTIVQGIDVMQPDSITQEHKGSTVDLKSPSGKGHKGTSSQVPKGTMSQPRQRAKGPKVPMTQEPKSTRAKLSNDPIALAKLEELYHQDPRPSLAAMGRKIGYPKGTVNDNLRKMKERGEL